MTPAEADGLMDRVINVISDALHFGRQYAVVKLPSEIHPFVIVYVGPRSTH